MPHIQRVDAERLGPRDEHAIAGLLVAVLDVRETGTAHLDAMLAHALGDLHLAQTEEKSDVFHPNHRS